MPMLDRKNLSVHSLESLITNKIFENKELEYKDYDFTDGKIDEKIKSKLLKEIAAFANTNGGMIIIGMAEDDDHLPIKLSGTGLTMAEYDGWLSAFRQLVLSRIRPHLHGVDCFPIVISDGTLVIVIYVVKSYARPHSFWDGNKDEFFIRYANGIAYMDIDDLRKQFLFGESVQQRIKQFRQDRISMILANECVGDLGISAKFVLHIIPEWSFELGNAIDIRSVERYKLNLVPISGSGWDDRYNADGFCMYGWNYDTKKIETYSQIFHNGIMEAVEIRLISGYKEKQVFDWMQTQDAIIKVVNRFEAVLNSLNIPKPWHIMAALLNANGYSTVSNGFSNSHPIDRDIINSQDGIWADGDIIDTALKPVLDSLSNAFGYRKSACYDDTGKIFYQLRRSW